MRLAQEQDIPQVLEHFKKFYEVSGYADFFSLDLDKVKYLCQQLIYKDDGVLIIEDDAGMLGARITQPYFSDDKFLSDLFWWVDPEKRRSGVGTLLISGLEAAAQEMGVEAVMVSMLDMSTTPEIRGKYERMGYTASETQFLRRI